LVAGSGIAETGAAAAAETDPTQTAGSFGALPLWISLAVLCLTYWCVDIVAPALPAMQESLRLSAASTGLIFSVFFAGRLLTNLPAAWFIERIGPKRTAVSGAVALGVGSLLVATASSPAILFPARGLQGAGVAILTTAGLLSVLRALPAGGAAMTAFNVSIGLGGSGGLLTGGYLTADLGWRAVFWLSAAISGLLLVGSLLARPAAPIARRSETSHREPGDVTGASRGGELAAIAANLLVFANYAIWVVSLPLLASVKFGFDAGQIGMILLFVNVVHLASAVPAGGIIRKAGASRALAAGFALSGVGLLLAPLAPSPPWLLPPLALYAIGQVAGNSSAGDLILRLGGGGGRAVGAVRLTSDIGLIVGPAAAGMAADLAGVAAPFFLLGSGAVVATIVAAVLGGRIWR
jgi:MFS family permease